MANETFVDTSGFYSLLVQGDRMHGAAADYMARAARNQGRFVTTDHVLDEAVTLLKARGHSQLLAPLFDSIENSTAMRIEWTTSERFNEARLFCLRHSDKAWSFTDSVSFLAMQSLSLTTALTSDSRFAQAGFQILLKP